MKIYKVITLFNFICILGTAVFYIYTSNDEHEKIIYINEARLFDEFDMTKEKKLEIRNNMKAATIEIDSLVSSYQNLADKTSEQAKMKQNQIVLKNRALQERQESHFKSSNSQIMKRLQDYIKAYALQNNYQMIIGSNVLYNGTLLDKTDEALLFINQKYSGLNL
jgi:Skp family chaperone for outer membrane proteins